MPRSGGEVEEMGRMALVPFSEERTLEPAG